MLGTIRQVVEESAKMTDQAGDQVTDQVKKLFFALQGGPQSTADLMRKFELSHRPMFRKNYLHPVMGANFIEITIPESPNAKNEKYILTSKGKRYASDESLPRKFFCTSGNFWESSTSWLTLTLTKTCDKNLHVGAALGMV